MPSAALLGGWWLPVTGCVLLLVAAAALGLLVALRRHRGESAAARAKAERLAEENAAQAAEGEFLRGVADAAPAGVFVADNSGLARYANPALKAMLGVREGESLIDPLLLAPEHRRMTVEAWRACAREGRRWTSRHRVVRPDGVERWVKAEAEPLADGTGWIGSVTDVHDEVESLARADRLSEVIAASPDAVILTDARGRYLYVNDAARRLVGLADDDELDGVDPLNYFTPESRRVFLRQALPTANAAGLWTGDLTLVLPPDDRELPVSQIVVAHRGDDGSVDHYSLVTRDESERQAYEARLLHQGLHDSLTGLPNRALALDRLAQALARAHREGTAVGVIVLDIDRFATVNDSYGHDTGDALLMLAAARLSGAVRAGDTAAHPGGDEFLVLCEDISGPAEAEEIAERLAAELSEPYELGTDSLRLSVSAGIAVSGSVRLTPHTLLADAGTALRHAKSRGRDRRETFAEEMRSVATLQLRTASDLHRALNRGEFRLVYQPEICLRTGRVVAVEALIRWQHPERGLVSPAEFVPLAEETGLVVGIGAWVLDEAAAQARRWSTARWDGTPLPVWVNLSARQLADPGLVATVERVLTRHGLRPGQLGLEITETAVLGDADSAAATLHELRELGLRLAVDDFGTGYSSLSHLKSLPVDFVKVDRGFVDGLGRDDDDTAIVGAVLAMAKALGLETIGEGVETPAQARALAELGCTMAQGFHFMPPRPAPLVTALLSGERSREVIRLPSAASVRR